MVLLCEGRSIMRFKVLGCFVDTPLFEPYGYVIGISGRPRWTPKRVGLVVLVHCSSYVDVAMLLNQLAVHLTSIRELNTTWRGGGVLICLLRVYFEHCVGV